MSEINNQELYKDLQLCALKEKHPTVGEDDLRFVRKFLLQWNEVYDGRDTHILLNSLAPIYVKRGFTQSQYNDVHMCFNKGPVDGRSGYTMSKISRWVAEINSNK